ncbi:MAG: hypothetical protein ACX94C_08515 [Phycisphaerales bacterium]
MPRHQPTRALRIHIVSLWMLVFHFATFAPILAHPGFEQGQLVLLQRTQYMQRPLPTMIIFATIAVLGWIGFFACAISLLAMREQYNAMEPEFKKTLGKGYLMLIPIIPTAIILATLLTATGKWVSRV